VSTAKISNGNAGANWPLSARRTPPSGKIMKKMNGNFLAERGTAVTLDGKTGALMLA
jgi:hypothetical protein